MKKKVTTDKVLYALIALGVVAVAGLAYQVYWLSLPFLFFLSGVIVGNLNETDVNNG